MDKPLVTVVIPCHNYARFVVDAIQSVQAQSLNNFECFVVCDACTDGSYGVIEKAIQGDARFHLRLAAFQSLSMTRNYGISLGNAPYLCCLDADDRMGSPEYLEVLVSELEKDRTIGIAFSSIQVMDESGKLGHVPDWPKGFNADAQYAHINQIPSLCVFRRDMWERAGGFRPYYRYVEDAEFWTTCIDIGYGAIHATTQPWFHYRLHNKSASQVHRTGEIPEPDWLEYHPWSKDGNRPLAAGGRAPRGSWPVRFYNEPEVSIIIPVGPGHEEMVKDALHSVEGQNHRLWECVVVNDTGYRLDLTGFPWAKVYDTKQLGAGGARNCGARYAKAPFLVFLDADDMLRPEFLALALETYRQKGRYVYTDWLTHDKMTHWQAHETPEYTFEAIREKSSIHPITCLIPKKWFMDVGGFDETLPAFEDVDLFMKFLTKGYCGVRLPKALLVYNLESGRRRKLGEVFRPKFESELKRRYGAFMEANTMCNCVEPPKGKPVVAPTPENAAEYKDTYGEMILARLMGQFTPEAPADFRGPATRVYYGRRAKGDVFYIWEADLLNSDVFERVENYGTEPESTQVPPPPPSINESEVVSEMLHDAVVQHMTDPESGYIEVVTFEPHEEDLTTTYEELLPFDATQERENAPNEEQPHKMSYGEMLDTLPPDKVTELRQNEWQEPPQEEQPTVLGQPVKKVEELPASKSTKVAVSNPRRGGKATQAKTTPKGSKKTK